MLMTRPNRQRPRPRIGQGTIPFPSRGLVLRKGVAEMRPDEALILDNWFPASGEGRIRGGHVAHATGLGGPVQSLMEWSGPASRKFFGATPTAIYDTTAASAVGTAAVSSLNSGYWQHVNFTTAGGSFLVACNGADDVRNYDGSSWTTPSITGVTSSDLINVAVYKSRLWFVEKDSTKAWVLGTGSISGAATSLELGDKYRNGGKLQIIGTISREGGSGPLDMICFVSSNGEIVVYQGSDPSDTANWLQVGRYNAASPIGNRAGRNIDGDFGLLTERGCISVRQLMGAGRSGAERGAITGNVDQGIIDDFTSYGGLTGWEMIVHPRSRQAIVNVPTNTDAAKQYAMNVQDGAWCTYSGLNAVSWGIYDDGLFFGGADGTVYQAERGAQDNGAEIPAELKTSFQNYGAAGSSKRVTLVRPQFTTAGPVTVSVRVDVDYKNITPAAADRYPSAGVGSGGVWDSALWDTAVWGDANTPIAEWLPVHGVGTTASVHLIARANGTAVKLQAFDLKYEVATGSAL